MAFFDPPKSSLSRRRVAANPLPIPPPGQANSSFRADKSPLLTRLFPEAARSASDNESNWQAQEMQRQREQQAQLEQRTRDKIARREAEIKAQKEADAEAKARAAEEKALAKQAEDDRKAKEKEALIAENTAFETKARAAGLGSDLYKADDNRWRLPYGEEEMQARSELNKRAAEEEAKKKAIDAEIASLSAEKGIKPYVTVEETKQAEKDLEEIFPVARSKALGSIDAKAQEFEKRGKSFFGLGGDPVAAKEAEKLKAKYEGLISDPGSIDEEELNASDPVIAARYKTAKEKLEATKQAKAWHDAMETKISMLKLKRDNPAKWEELHAKELANAPDADLGKMADEIKATDAGTTAQAQEREKLLQQNREKLSAGVAPGETVTTADGQVVHKDLAPELEKLTPTKDPDADVKRKLISDEIQRRIAINDAKVKEYYGRLRSSPLYADIADKYEALDAEQATRLKEVDDKASDPAQYKEMRGIVIDDIRNKRNAIEEAKAGRAESEKKILALTDQFLADYNTTIDAGVGRGNNTKIDPEKAKEIASGIDDRYRKNLDKLAKEVGLDSASASLISRDYIEAKRPWANAKIDGSRILPSGTVMIHPEAIWDDAALNDVKQNTKKNFGVIGKNPNDAEALIDKQVAEMRERSSHEVFADLMDAPVFQKWLEKNKLPGDKGMTGEQKAGLILKFNHDKTWWDRLSNDAKQGLYAGLTDVQQQAWSLSTAGSDGLYAATRLQYFRDIADSKRLVAEMYGRDVETFNRARTAAGKYDLIPGVSIGDVGQAAPSIAESMIPGIALARLSQAKKIGVLARILTGAKTEMTAEKALQVAGVAGMRGATAGAFVQSFSSSYGRARSGFMAQGMSRDEAEQQALWSATKAGLSTAALTRLFGLHGMEAALGSNPTMRELFKLIGKDGLRNSLKSQEFRKLFADALGTVGMEAMTEVPEESLDQLVQGLMEKASYNPDKTWKEVFDETMNAGGVALFLGGTGPLVAGANGMVADATEKILAKGQSNPATPAANPATPAIPAPNTPAATPENIVKATSDIANAPPPADAADTGIDWPATQTAATAIVQIGTGNIAALSDDELKSVGLTRNDKGVIEQSQPGKDSPAPLVKMENGEPIILDAGTALLEQHFPDARQLIAQTETERRAEIEAQQQQDQQTTTEDPSTPEAPTSDTPQPTDAGATESPPSDTATAAPPGTGPAGVDTNSLPDYEQQIVSILEESYGFPSDDAKAIAKDHLARRGVTKTDANGVPDAQMQVLEDVESELGQAGIQDVTEKTDGISKRYLKRFAKDRKAAETARATANEQRASALAYRLGSEDARVGLRSGEGKIAVRKWVRNNPVPLDANGNPDVDADFKAFRESIAAYDIPMGPSNPIRQKTPSEERAEQAKAKAAETATPKQGSEQLQAERTTRHRVFEGGSPIRVTPGEDVLEARDETKAYRITGKPQIDDMLESGEVRAKLGKMRGGRKGETQWSRGHSSLGYRAGSQDGVYVVVTSANGLNDRGGGLPLHEVEAIYQSQNGKWVDVTDKIKGKSTPGGVDKTVSKTPVGQSPKTASKATLPRNISTAVGKLPDALRPKALKLLKPLLETLRKYESVEIFSDIRFVDEFPAGTGGMRLAPDGALEIHLPTVANDSIKRIRAALSEEAIHAIAVRVIDKAQVVSLWNSLPRELQQAVRKVYFASYEVNGETLPEGDAFSMGHEAIRMMVQDKAFLGRITEAQGLAGKVKAILETLLSELRRMIDAAPAEAKRELEAARDSVISALEEVGIIESRAIAENTPASEAPATRELSRRENAANKLRSMMGLPPLNASAKVTAEDDSRYLELAKDPKANRDTLQAMVDESAKAAGYDGLFFHGTNAVFNTFSVTSPPNRVHGHPSRVMGAFLTNRKDSASSYALTAAGKIGGTPRVIRAFVRLKNPKEFTIREFYNRYDGFQKNDWKRKEAIAKRDAEAFQKDGFDGISVGDGFEVAIFNPNQIKSADPVTYDETGNVIPLSQRFNPDSNSILYAPAKPSQEAPKTDAEYMAAVESGDMETAQRLVDEAANNAGYLPHGDFRDQHSAPSSGAESDAAVIEDGEDASLEQVARGVHIQPNDYFDTRVGPRYYGYDDANGMEAFRALNRAFASLKAGKKTFIKVYRAVPIEIQATKLENRDWVSPSKGYAIDHGESRFGEGEYRIIEEVIPANQLFWDGNDIREWGKDDGFTRYYKNTPNNIKSADPITYDAAGNVIPLSQRFNPDVESILYAGEKPTKPAIDYKSSEFRNVASELGNSLYEAGFTDPMAFASELNTLLDGNGDARLFGRIWTESEGYNPDDDQPKWGQLLAEIRKPVATEELETGYFKGDKVVFTDDPAPPGFRSFTYLEGPKVGTQGVQRTPEAKKADAEAQIKQFSEQQAAFKRLRDSGLSDQMPKTKEPSPAKAEYQVDETLQLQSPFMDAPEEVSYRGPLPPNKAVVVTSRGTQMSVDMEWLRRKGEDQKVVPQPQVAEVTRVDEPITVTEEAPVKADRPLESMTKRELVEEYAGPEPTEWQAKEKYRKLLKALAARSKESLIDSIRSDRESDAKFKVEQRRTSEHFNQIKPVVDDAGQSWRSEIAKIAAVNGIENWSAMPDNTKGEEIARLASRLSKLETIELSAPAEAPTDSLPADGSTPGGVDQPVAKKTKSRTIPTVKSKASEIIRSGMFETISALADIKIAPPSPAIPLIRSREKRGMKLSELEMKLLRDNRDYDGYPSQKSVMDRGDGGKVAAEILSRIMSGKERPDNAADFWRQGSKPSEMWDALVEELYAVAEGRGTAMDDARDSYEEGKVNEMEAQLDRFEAANRPAPGRTEIDAKTLTVGDKLVVDGEILTVSGLEMNQETGEADTVILDDHYRFGRQFLEGGDSVFVEEAWSGEGWNNYENAPNEAPQTQPAPEVGPADTQTTPISQKEAAALITKDRAKQILADSNIKDRPIRTYEQAVAANQDHMGTKISDWNAFPFNGDISSEGRPLQDLSGRDKDFTKAPTLFPSGQFAPNCEWCGHQPVKNFYFIEHPEKKWTLAVGSECIAHFSNLSGDELGSQAAEGKARMLISGIQEQSRTLSREFLYTTTDSYGRSTSKWMLTEAKPIYEKLNATKGKIDKDSTKGTLMRWLKAKGTDAELLAVQYAELMGSDQAKSIMIKSRQSKLSSLEDKIGSKQYRDGPRFGPTKIYNYTETQIENFSKAAAKLKAEISGLSGEAVVAQSTTGQELFQSNEMPFNLVAETAEDIRKREEAEIKAENERKAKEAAAAKAENDKLQGNLFDQSPEQANELYASPRATVEVEVEPGFYSQLASVIEDKIQGKQSTPEQLKALITNPNSGIKQEEIKWTGVISLIDQIAYSNDGKVPKAELLAALENEMNGQFKEVAQEGDKTAFGEHTLPGGKNYREVVLSIPSRVMGDAYWAKLQEFQNNYEDARVWDLLNEQADTDYDLFETGEFGDEEAKILKKYDVALKKWEKENGRPIQTSDKDTYMSPHFDAKGYVAHMRVNERTDADGNPGMFVEEFQSDRHQEGRKKGYKGELPGVKIASEAAVEGGMSKEDAVRIATAMAESPLERTVSVEDFRAFIRAVGDRVNLNKLFLDDPQLAIPDAPFRTTWPLQLFKRALRDAVASGKTWIGWTSGATQNDRFDLSKQVEAIKTYRNADGTYWVTVSRKGYGADDDFRTEDNISKEKLPDVIGKDLAERVIADVAENETAPERGKVKRTFLRYTGLELKTGGKGMIGFYDNMLPKEIAKYVKQWGAKVVKSEIITHPGTKPGSVRLPGVTTDRPADKTPIWRVDITPEMAASIESKGQALYASPPVPQPGGNTTSGPGQHPLRAFVEPEGTDWGLYGRKVSKPGKDSWTTAERDAVAKTFDAAGIKPIMISPTTGQPIDDSFIISSADQKQLIAALLERRRDRQAKAKANGATQQKIDDFVEKAHKAQRGIGWALAKVVAAPARLISWAMPKGVAKALDVVGNNNIDQAFVSAIERAATGVASTDVAKGVAKAMNSLAGTKGGQVTAEIAQNLIHWAKKNFIPQSLWGKEFAAKIREMNVTKQFMTETSMDVIRALKGTEKFTDLMMPERWRTDTAMHERIWRVLDGQADVATLPKELHHTVKTLRELSRKAGLEAVRTGRMSLETFRAMDKEGYVTHYYDNDSEGIIDKIVRRVPVLKNQGYVHARRMEAWRIEDTQTKDPNAPNLNALVNFQPGKFRFSSKAHRDAFYEQFLREQVVETIKKSRPKGLSGSANQAISTLTPAQLLRLERLPADLRGYISRISEQQRGRWIKKRPLTQEEKEKAGLIMDPFYATARHILQMGHDNATAKFFNEVVKLPDVVSSTDIAGFKKIADDARFGALRGKYVREDLHEQLQEIANVNDSVMRIADNMLTLWKTGKTVLNPSTHFRNIMGNVAFSGLAGNNILNPAKWENYRRAIRAIRDGGPDLKLLIQNGITGNDFASAELAQALKRMIPNADLVDTEKSPMQIVGMLVKGGLNAGLGKVFDLYGIEDDLYKAATFFKKLQDGMTEEKAAEETRKWFPYYDQIGTSGALKWTRRVVPFFSFQREALRIMGNAAKERPLMLTAQLSMFWGLTQLSMMALGLRDEDKEDVEKELRGHLKFSDAPVFSMLLPWRDSEGRLQQWDMSNVMPFAKFLGRNVGFDRSEDPASSELLKLLTAQNPFVSLMTSHISNKDAYTGKPIWEDSMTPEEKRGKAFGHAWNVLVPPLMGTSLDVLKNAGTRTTNKSLETRNTPQAWARSIAGFDIRNATPDFYDAVDKYMTKHEMPGKPGGQWSSTPEYRARAELWGQLVQDEPDYRKAGALLKYLKTEHQETFDTPKSLSGLLDTRNPLKALGADEKRKMTAAEVKADFLSSLSGETGDAVRKSLAEFERIKMQAPARLEKAKAFMK